MTFPALDAFETDPQFAEQWDAQRVYLWLLGHCLDFAQIRPVGTHTLALRLRLKPQAVHRAINFLADRGLVTHHGFDAFNRRNLTLCWHIGANHPQENAERSRLQTLEYAPRRRMGQRARAEGKRAGKLACLICGAVEVHMHHIIPIACGGPDELQNIAPLCLDHHKLAHRLSPLILPWRGPRNRIELVEQITRFERAKVA